MADRPITLSSDEPDDATDTGAPEVRIGCSGLPSGVARSPYFQKLDLLELDQTFYEPPRDAALRRWRREEPAGCAFSVLAWQLITHDASTPGYARMATPLPPEARSKVGLFRATPEVKAAWERTLSSARALEAEVVVFQTPSSFSPSETNKDMMRRFFGEIVGEVPESLTLAWEPRGVWEPAQAEKLATELGLVYALDPLQLETPPPEQTHAYFRLYGLGLYRNKISDDHLDVLAELVEQYDKAWVVFHNVQKFADAQRFKKLLASRDFIVDEEHEGDEDADDELDGDDGDNASAGKDD